MPNMKSVTQNYNPFKEQYNNHTGTFGNNAKQKSTELSKCIWELKQSSIQYQINLGIALRAHP